MRQPQPPREGANAIRRITVAIFRNKKGNIRIWVWVAIALVAAGAIVAGTTLVNRDNLNVTPKGTAAQDVGSKAAAATPTPVKVEVTRVVASTPVVIERQVGIQSDQDPLTQWAKGETGLDVQRIQSEYAAFVWRGAPSVANARIPPGMIATVHTTTDGVQVCIGEGQMLKITAGTFRVIKEYPDGDAVYNPCQLLAKEQEFASRERPSYTVSARNFSCEASAPSAAPTPVAIKAQAQSATQDPKGGYTAETFATLFGVSSTRVEWLAGENGWKIHAGTPPTPFDATDGIDELVSKGWLVNRDSKNTKEVYELTAYPNPS